MEDPMNPGTTAYRSLPPGCRFYPSEEQLLRHYLTNKNDNSSASGLGCDVIRDVDLYGCDPFDLPESACYSYGYCGRRRHWYCYAGTEETRGKKRRAGSGYWKRKGRVRDVVGRGKAVCGKRSAFVFYLGNSPKTAVRTDWVMYEYALVGHSKASFVLCRVFIKSRGGNNTSEHGLSSCAEESVATVRHIGIQHDGSIASDVGEAKVHYDSYVPMKNETIKFSPRLASEQNDQIPLGIPSNILGRLAGHTSGCSVFVDGVATEQLKTILQEDFLELDDLVFPLSGIDYSG